MQISGKWLIISILTIALAMAGFAWSFQYFRGRRVLELWGAERAKVIRIDSTKVELLELRQPTLVVVDSQPEPEKIKVAGEIWQVAKVHDITEARGLIHARQALIEDATFDWEKPRGDCQANWEYVLRFTFEKQSVDIAFDTHCDRLRLLGSDREVAIASNIAEGMKTFIGEIVKPETASVCVDDL